MAKRFLSSLKLLNLSSDPQSGSSGEIFYNQSENSVKYHDGLSWVSLASSGDNFVSSGSSYPTTDLADGQLFYNTSNGRTAIYFDSFWKEFAYANELVLSINGGNSSSSFDDSIDGGLANTTVFIGSYDGGQA
jgi:hypothetical protein